MRPITVISLLAAVSLGSLGAGPPPAPQVRQTVFEATLEAPSHLAPELSTKELEAFLASGHGLLLDARTRLDYDLAHIPGAVSIEQKGLLRIVQALPATTTAVVVYSDGPFSALPRRLAEELQHMGYTGVSRYQLGIAVWRALGNTSETSLDGMRSMYRGSSAVFIDARARADYLAGTIPAAETVLAGEVTDASRDHRLQYYDHATRIVVFGNSGAQARLVAEDIARHAFTNSSFFNGTYQDLKSARFFSERKPSPFNLDGLLR
jgi:rhodanese-related sulfurtransferase